MGLPKKALRESNLKELTAGSAVKDGSHIITRVTFIEDGIEKLAYFKRLEPKNHYPEFLAKISTAASFFKRLFQGKNSAEERLVFDENDKLVGTLSIGIKGFKSFNFAEDPVPVDPILKEKVIPSTKTLLDKNIMSVLFGRWYLDDDDGHGHQMGILDDEEESADLDFDMFFYWFTVYMKEPRPIIGVPKKRIDLSVRDWETFPKVKDSKPYHWPTFKHPGQETLPSAVPSQILQSVLPKKIADHTQFEQLAHEPRAHEQKFVAAMKALMTYQPEMVRKRLLDLFGDMTVNYTSLDATDVNLRILYETEFPELCNNQTNVMSFVDFMMNIYQKHYDNLYRVVVFYMGCENNGNGVALDSTYLTLYTKPSIYKGIAEWMKTQNDTLYKKDDASLKYDLDELQHRYHQIWRDTYALTVKDLLHNTFNLTKRLLDKVCVDQPDLVVIEGKTITDASLTNAWELFGAMPELSIEQIEPLIRVDKESNFRDGILMLVNFYQSLHNIVKTYYCKERRDLTEEDNLAFCNSLNDLHKQYNLALRQKLFHTSSYAAEFNPIAIQLKQLTEHANFQLHLITTDEMMKDAIRTTVEKDLLPHTHEEVIKKYNKALFEWANSIKPEELTLYITEIIDKYYTPTLESLSYRHRSQPVKDFLAASMNQSGNNRLAYILSSGKEETGALNKFLIQYLTPIMLQTQLLPSISNAVRKGTFDNDIALFTKSAVNYAKFDNQFTHLYHPEGIRLFYSTIFDWVDKLPDDRFNEIKEEAIKEYEAGLSKVKFWGPESRRKEVEGYCKSFGHAKAVALTFINGSDSSTMKTCLFDRLIAEMKSDISKSADMRNSPGCKLIAQYDPAEHKTHIFACVKEHSVPPSHKQDIKESSSSALTI
ncbi:hypothetical protein [Legionella bononiensis]|uniref:Uncharacterized protein n=1 Tax=Legionella bononiensis TaxID=2793102 RepID=A0ABS1WFK4_9GAMM|nr:hypothetical protein [Legionella bononiensis]MBL7481601.1 hypothetical protein [Legionella bononiensis]MBL7528148.1 hypothetical protein [Legionella bononiensis]MBL7562624.1 hypothetical protein [Legionella bononiensis]